MNGSQEMQIEIFQKEGHYNVNAQFREIIVHMFTMSYFG